MKTRELKISLIAEELNEEVLKEKKATSCTALDIARSLSVDHLFCDPDRSQRKSLGIPTDSEIYGKMLSEKNNVQGNLRESFRREKEKFFGLREEFWFERMGGRLDNHVLFICGADHIPGFCALLSEKGHDSKILVRDWEEVRQ